MFVAHCGPTLAWAINRARVRLHVHQEVVGGMLELMPQSWTRPERESAEEQRARIHRFAEMWRPYDWTQRLAERRAGVVSEPKVA